MIWDFEEIVGNFAVALGFDGDIVFAFVRPVATDVEDFFFVPAKRNEEIFGHASIATTAAHQEDVFIFREESL